MTTTSTTTITITSGNYLFFLVSLKSQTDVVKWIPTASYYGTRKTMESSSMAATTAAFAADAAAVLETVSSTSLSLTSSVSKALTLSHLFHNVSNTLFKGSKLRPLCDHV